MTLYEYLLKLEEDTEVTVHDAVYEMEIYFNNYFDEEISWDNSMKELSKLLTIKKIVRCTDTTYVTVNLSEVIENKINELKKSDLFIRCNVDSIMYDIDNIIAGYVSENWMKQFVDVLKGNTNNSTMTIDDVVRRLNDGLDRTEEELEMCKRWLIEYQLANDMSLIELDDLCFEDSVWVFDNIFN